MATRTFRTQIVLLFGVLYIATILPTYWYINTNHRAQQIEYKREILSGISQSVATVIAENLTERTREIILLSQSPLYRESSLKISNVRASMERVKDSYRLYSWIGMADTKGRVQVATSGHLEGADVTMRPWFQEGLKRPFIGDVHEALLLAKLLPNKTGLPTRFIDFAVPIKDDAGRTTRVLAAHANWHWAGALLAGVTPPQATRDGIEIFILNSKNEVIYPENLPASFKAPNENDIAHNRVGPFTKWGATSSFLTASARVPPPENSNALGWRIVVRQDTDHVLSDVNVLQRVNFLTMVISALAFIAIAWAVAIRVSSPVEALTKIARRIEKGEQVKFPDTFQTKELQNLSKALQGMSSTLIEQKEELSLNNQDLEAKVSDRTVELQLLNLQLEKLARTDSLTGLPNRMFTQSMLVEEFARFKRSKVPYSVLVLDVDHFKRINDKFGHAVGDDVLTHVAHLLQTTVRKTDFVGRIGGEEFMAILPLTDSMSAMNVAEKICKVIASTSIAPVGAITVSIGAKEVQQSDIDENVAVAAADAAMYKAKAKGRNRVFM